MEETLEKRYNKLTSRIDKKYNYGKEWKYNSKSYVQGTTDWDEFARAMNGMLDYNGLGLTVQMFVGLETHRKFEPALNAILKRLGMDFRRVKKVVHAAMVVQGNTAPTCLLNHPFTSRYYLFWRKLEKRDFGSLYSKFQKLVERSRTHEPPMSSAQFEKTIYDFQGTKVWEPAETYNDHSFWETTKLVLGKSTGVAVQYLIILHLIGCAMWGIDWCLTIIQDANGDDFDVDGADGAKAFDDLAKKVLATRVPVLAFFFTEEGKEYFDRYGRWQYTPGWSRFSTRFRQIRARIEPLYTH
jgi:hypothetical protein